MVCRLNETIFLNISSFAHVAKSNYISVEVEMVTGINLHYIVYISKCTFWIEVHDMGH